ncbi:MAG TPA: deoxyribodipyrimidine photo-lyase [Pararhizobium sp.]|uniref:cryptochrome/photolyase family protein n=1 Tax=Pararhizobium sp. TaxID=1977563 RepID=UPI002CA745AB|nr:deoxyribodipyrimidine photo-lyase [Pararhizobium sp.]HTO30664.1 deoxyribodipyrimidine photo-lyase [Pararhizobium sp.]
MQNSNPPPNGPILIWFRKDLRLDDNHALHASVQSGRGVIPVYIREPAENGTGPLGAAQAWWLHHSLHALSESLSNLGSSLLLLTGKPQDVFARLVVETGASGIYWNRRYDPDGIGVDGALKNRLGDIGMTVKSFAGQILHEPARWKTGSGTPYRVYTPFWRALEASGEPDAPLDAPTQIPAPADWPKSEKLADWNLLPAKPDWAETFREVWTPGEAAALERLQDFIDETLDGYKANRDLPARDGTSRLSPHLALGEISPARIWHATRNLKDVPVEDIVTFRKELVWRDFSYHLLFHNPDLPRENLNRRYDRFEWADDGDAFKLWTKGRTGYPIVDAGMRQLWRHGTMHNRVRMIAASFLIKDLLIDWRRGEAWFRDTLVDADPASNAASWQWVAGSGADASPFFRVFNPILQGEKFDPDGTYVKTFVPELQDMPTKFVHRPFEAPATVLTGAGVTLGETYPKPLVDHAKARDRALAAYGNVKDAA